MQTTAPALPPLRPPGWSWARRLRMDGTVVVAVLVFLGRLAPSHALVVSQPAQPAGVGGGPMPGAASSATPAPAAPLPGTSYRAQLAHQQSLVNLLDDRLRSLDNIHELRYRAEANSRRLEELERRLSDLDNKLDRKLGEIVPALERRFDRLTEALAAHDHKSSLSREQLARKVDTVYERIVYMENNSVNKLQLSAGRILEHAGGLRAAVEQVGASVNATHGDTLARLANVSSTLELGVRVIEDLEQHVKGSQDEAEEPGGAGCRTTQVTAELEAAAKSIKQHVDTKADLMSSKVSSLYNDMWQRVNVLDSMVKSGVSTGNATRRDVQELRVAVRGQQQRHLHPPAPRADPPSGNLEMALEALEQEIQRRLTEVHDTLYDQVRDVQKAQDIFLRTCGRLDHKEEELEEKIGKVLDRLVDMVVHHDKDLSETQRLLKAHNHQVSRALTGAVGNATEGGRHLEQTILSLSEQVSQDSKRVEEVVRRVLTAVHNGSLAVDGIASAIQGVSERVAGCPQSLGPSDEETWSALLQQANETSISQQQQQDQANTSSPHDDVTQPEPESHPPPPPPHVYAQGTGSGSEQILMFIHGLQRLADTYSAQQQLNKTFEQFINDILPQSSHTAKERAAADLRTLEDEDYLIDDNEDDTEFSYSPVK